MAESWIKIHRQIQSHWIWKDAIKFQWWVDILMTVNFVDAKVNIGFELYDCKRGQSVKSLQTWAERWKTSKDTARNFLKLLEKDGMIIHENIGKSTRITVCNYESYQSDIHDKQTQSKRKANDNQTQSHAIKESIEEEKEKKDKDYKKTLLSEIKISDFENLNNDYIIMAKSFHSLFRANIIDAGGSVKSIDNAKGTWIDSIRLMIEEDKYSINDLREVHLFLQRSDFWKKNILSTSKLREQMVKLKMQIKNEQPTSKNGSNGQASKSNDANERRASVERIKQLSIAILQQPNPENNQ